MNLERFGSLRSSDLNFSFLSLFLFFFFKFSVHFLIASPLPATIFSTSQCILGTRNMTVYDYGGTKYLAEDGCADHPNRPSSEPSRIWAAAGLAAGSVAWQAQDLQPGEGSAVCTLPSQSIAGIPADKPLADFVPKEITGSA